jgi:hypothetical protein
MTTADVLGAILEVAGTPSRNGTLASRTDEVRVRSRAGAPRRF